MYTQIVLERPEELLRAAERIRHEDDTFPHLNNGKLVFKSIIERLPQGESHLTGFIAELEGDGQLVWKGKGVDIITAAFKRLGIEVEFK